MNFFEILLTTFILILTSELGDKSLLFILSISNKNNYMTLIFGIIIGTILSHGLIIYCFNDLYSVIDTTIIHTLQYTLNFLFILIGVYNLINSKHNKTTSRFIEKIINFKFNKLILIIIVIIIGEFGDKTLLTSLLLSIKYQNYLLAILLGAILGMLFTNISSIYLGKILNKYIDEKKMKIVSNTLFILFGIFSFLF